MSSFRNDTTLERRQDVSKTITEKYPDRIPAVVEWGADLKVKPGETVQTPRTRFLIPRDCAFGRFQYKIRETIKLPDTDALFVFVERPDGSHVRPFVNTIVGDIYNRNAWDDGFLYIYVSSEATFGGGMIVFSQPN